MKALFNILLILAILSVVCVVTCPKKDAHVEALTDLATSIVNEEISNDLGVGDAAAALVSSFLGTGVGEWAVDNLVTVKNYFLFSIGYIKYEGESKPVSFGIFNHVFTPNKEMVGEMMTQYGYAE